MNLTDIVPMQLCPQTNSEETETVVAVVGVGREPPNDIRDATVICGLDGREVHHGIDIALVLHVVVDRIAGHVGIQALVAALRGEATRGVLTVHFPMKGRL